MRTEILSLAVASGILCLQTACMRSASNSSAHAERRDINQVLVAHQGELLQIPGVVGVFVGLAEDNKTQCIKVMLKSPDPVAQMKIPKELEGFLVITEVTGEIRPLRH
jgi:hypothetical protein